MGRRTPTRAFLYGLGFRLGELSLRAALRVLPRVPERWLEAIWEAVWRLTFLLQRRRARRMEANLALVMPERFETRAERRTVVRTACRHLYRSVLDATLAVTHEAARARRKAIPIEGAERLEAALARGRGVVAVTAHLGGFTMVPIRLAVDHPVSLVANRPDDARVAGLLDRCREVVGVATVPVRPAREAARGALVALREGRVLVLLADEFKTGGVEVEFLGHPASAPRGPGAPAGLRPPWPGRPLAPGGRGRDRAGARRRPGRGRLDQRGAGLRGDRRDDPPSSGAVELGQLSREGANPRAQVQSASPRP
jgi:KDO2-lipid IV(A) lauroyltransferase